MPIYEYRCTNGHTFDVFQSMTDEPVSTCEVCGEPVERVFSPVAVHYKGSGFYTTDYARKGAGGGSDGGGKAGSDSGSSDSKSSDVASKAEPSSKSSGSSGSGSSD